VGDHDIDNRWVVCHSLYLIWKYRCYINVESIASIKAVKYIYKYVYKGHDRTTMQFGRSIDEVKLYLDVRYISSCKAMWRLYVIIFATFSFLFPSHDCGKPNSYLPSLYGLVELHNIVYSPTFISPLSTYL